MSATKNHISIVSSVDGYYESIDNSRPFSLRVKAADDNWLHGEIMGQPVSVPKSRYRKMQRMGVD